MFTCCVQHGQCQLHSSISKWIKLTITIVSLFGNLPVIYSTHYKLYFIGDRLDRVSTTKHRTMQRTLWRTNSEHKVQGAGDHRWHEFQSYVNKIWWNTEQKEELATIVIISDLY